MLKDFSLDSFDIIIQAGQSNSEGYGIGDASDPYEENEYVWFLNSNFTISRAAEVAVLNNIRGNAALSFAREYIKNGKLKEGRKLLIIRSAVGGTSFSDNRWGMCDDLFLQMMNLTRVALELNPNNRLIAMLWHQGENDAANNIDYKTHYTNLLTLINEVKKQFKCPNLPFITADFVSIWKLSNKKICEPISKAIKDICNYIGNSGFVETNDLLSNAEQCGGDDTIHFSRESLYKLGKTYFYEYCRIVDN